MESPIDFLIVGSPDDLLSQAIQQDFAQRGKKVSVLEPMAAAQLFTVAIRHGQVRVSPDLPMLLRPTTPDLMQPDFDHAFHHGEALSTLWAVAAACQSPVLNRPTPKSLWGLTSVSTVLTQQRAKLPVDTEECFTGHRPSKIDLPVDWQVDLPADLPADLNSISGNGSSSRPDSRQPEQAWFIQDMGNFSVTQAPAVPSGHGPYRSRHTYRQGRYEQVVVLVDRAWRSTQVPLGELGLERRSIELLRKLELDFGVVIWNVTPDLAAATLAKVEIFPTLEQVGWVWDQLSARLYQEIFG